MTDERHNQDEAESPQPDAPAEKRLLLHPKLARRVTRGHLWVFSNEVASEEGDPLPGDEVAIYDHRRRLVGMGLYSRSSLIRARIYSRRRGQICDAELIALRLRQALDYRRAVAGGAPLPQSHRLLNSESDGLPGAIVDVFGDCATIQIGTAGMEARRDALVAAVRELINPASIVERSDTPVRALEGLQEVRATVFGEPPSTARIEEDGAVMFADLMEGQKTGYYLDQIRNRALAKPMMAGRSVLDLFCYAGAWSYTALAGGAESALAIDGSARALELAREALPHNPAAEGRIEFEKADIFTRLREMAASDRRFGAIILDPPPLAKNRRDADNALRGYRELNLRAMQLLEPGGLLATFCCSHVIGPGDFEKAVMMAAKGARCDFSVVARPCQPPDHPVHLLTPETSYLKSLFLMKREF